jgi:hypothetical protein
MEKLLGQRIEFKKLDKDDPLQLPVSGEIVKDLRATNNIDGLFLLKLDRPFEHKGIDSQHVLFWSPLIEDHVQEQVRALILLIPDMKLLNQANINEEAFIPFDWAQLSQQPMATENTLH